MNRVADVSNHLRRE